jgi:Endosomal/lysosomal potassium channel TMEM175
LPGEEHAPEARGFVGTTRLEAFSDGVFAIAITLLVLDLTIPESGPALDRVLDAWPFYLACVVSFLTIGGAWLAHTAITDRLAQADPGPASPQPPPAPGGGGLAVPYAPRRRRSGRRLGGTRLRRCTASPC